MSCFFFFGRLVWSGWTHVFFACVVWITLENDSSYHVDWDQNIRIEFSISLSLYMYKYRYIYIYNIHV